VDEKRVLEVGGHRKLLVPLHGREYQSTREATPAPVKPIRNCHSIGLLVPFERIVLGTKQKRIHNTQKTRRNGSFIRLFSAALRYWIYVLILYNTKRFRAAIQRR